MKKTNQFEKKETETNTTQKLVMLAASDAGCVMHRNNRGGTYNPAGQFIKYGVGEPGGSDLIGWTPTLITADMIGKTVAVFTAFETKKPGWKPRNAADEKRFAEQKNFVHQLNIAGGIGAIVTGDKDVEAALRRKRGVAVPLSDDKKRS